MAYQHLVRVGILGHVGSVAAADARSYTRGARVICRTDRGLEVGQVLAPDKRIAEVDPDGTLLRGVTVEDELLLARLEKHRDQAYSACVETLSERQLSPILVDVEHLFDGRTVYFYFLGEITSEIEALTREWAEVYERKIQLRKFSETLVKGCGPGCGTEDASGCSSVCAGCSVGELCSNVQRRSAED